MKELVEDIRSKGLIEPITLHEDKILDGRNRLFACAEIGLEPVFEEWRSEKITPFEWVLSRNIKRRQLTASQRAGLAARLLKHSKLYGSNLDLIYTDYKERKAVAASWVGASITYMMEALQLSEQELDSLISGKEEIANIKQRYTKSINTGENEWYTPQEYLSAAKDVLGEFDVDPASSDKAQETVKAKKYFTKEENGLTKEWKGRVWLNPPYVQPDIEHFTSKLVKEYLNKNVTEAILLTHNYTDTKWFQNTAVHSSTICFTKGRIRFYDSKGKIAAPTQGQAFFYFGSNMDKFNLRFSEFGFLVCLIS